jgi:4-amino-4-deoxy-L-arabinose transferase-like glycosyltransferase
MIQLKQIILLILIFFSLHVFSQEEEEIDPMPIKLKGVVLNLEDETPVPNATILNYRTHSTVITDELGRFTMDMLNIDSLAISSLGYSKTTAHVPANYMEMNVLILYAKPIRYALPQVTVAGKKLKVEGLPTGKKVNIDPELRGDAYNKKPPVIAAVVNPASYIQYYLSKSERDKRETRKAIVSEKQWEYLSQIYNKPLVMEVTGINEVQADLLMLYINNKDRFSEMRGDYEIRNIIKEEYENYKKEAAELQKENEK